MLIGWEQVKGSVLKILQIYLRLFILNYTEDHLITYIKQHKADCS